MVKINNLLLYGKITWDYCEIKILDSILSQKKKNTFMLKLTNKSLATITPYTQICLNLIRSSFKRSDTTLHLVLFVLSTGDVSNVWEIPHAGFFSSNTNNLSSIDRVGKVNKNQSLDMEVLADKSKSHLEYIVALLSSTIQLWSTCTQVIRGKSLLCLLPNKILFPPKMVLFFTFSFLNFLLLWCDHICDLPHPIRDQRVIKMITENFLPLVCGAATTRRYGCCSGNARWWSTENNQFWVLARSLTLQLIWNWWDVKLQTLAWNK